MLICEGQGDIETKPLAGEIIRTDRRVPIGA